MVNMRIIKKMLLIVENISFKSKIAIVFFIFCILQTIIMSAIFFQQNIDTIRQNSAAQLLNVVQTKNENVDIRLKAINESIVLFNFDSKLFEITESYEQYSAIEKLSVPNEIYSQFFRYFSDAPDIYAINILSSKYSVSNKPYRMEYSDFVKSPELYNPDYDRNFFQYWIPRFDILDYVQEVNPISDARYGFATVKRLNLTALYNSSFITLSPLIERPYLLIVFNESFFQDYYLNATSYEESNYMIISQNGEIVSSDHYTHEDQTLPLWFHIAKEKKSGITYVKMDGNETLVSFATSDVTGWISAITTPVSALTLNAASSRRQLILISLVLAVIMLIFYFQTATLLAKPIKLLVKSAGGLDNLNNPTSNEIKILSYAFENVDQKLKNLMKENYNIKLNEKEARIAILNAQLKPHFIYNTLNTINWMAVESNDKKISNMVVSLSSILQYTFRNYEIIVHFAEEMEWLKQYLFIMSNRFNGKFVVEYDIDPVLYNCYIPKLLLQPLVENSIIHGFKDRSSGGIITISGWIFGDDLHLSVMDNGCGIPMDKVASILSKENSSIGCVNTDNKLKLIYGSEYGIQVTSTVNRGTTVTVTMPVRYIK